MLYTVVVYCDSLTGINSIQMRLSFFFLFQGIVSRDEYFLKAYTKKYVLSVHAN
jgi:hypothetical protein